MNKRQEELLTIILSEKNYLNISEVAKRLECSERTIRNNCNDINDWLSTFCSMNIKRTPNLGIKLIGDENERLVVNQKLRREVKRVNSDIHKHIEILNLIVLSSMKKVTLNEICNVLYTNKNVAREEINKISKKLQEYELEINTKKNSGIFIEGSEKNIRIMIVDYLSNYIDEYRLNIEEIDCFHIVDVIITRNIMSIIEDRLNIRFTDTSFKQMMLFLLISIIRIRRGNYLDVGYENKEDNLGDIIKEINNELKSNLSITINKNEKTFITSLINSMNKQINNKESKDYLYSDRDLVEYTKKIIKEVSIESGINFEQDILLYEQLLCHINVTMQQVKNKVNIQNPLLDDIKSKYCFLFTVISNVVRNENMDENISEDEIGYLVLHFQVSLERKNRRREDLKKISIVCPLSFGVSTLLRIKIEKTFDNIEVVEIIREEDLKRGKFDKNIDFIVAFRDYENIDIPMFITTPLFTEEDNNKLKEFISSIKTKDSSYKIMNKLMVSDYFIRELEHNNIYDAIEYLAKMLAEKHYVDEEYIDAVVEREKTYPTNIGNGILLPHGDIKYVNQSILCFARLKNPIKIKNGHTIKFIIMLAYRNDDRKEFQNLFKEIASLTEDKDMIEKLTTCNISDINKILI